MPESFEWLILSSGLIPGVTDVMDHPSEHIDSSKYFSWEQFFTSFLISRTKGSYLTYKKERLNPVYKQNKEKKAIIESVKRVIT